MSKRHSPQEVFPFTVLAVVTLGLSTLLFGSTYLIDAEIPRYYCLGASTGALVLSTTLFAIAKFSVWPRHLWS